MEFKLRFSTTKIRDWSEQYDYYQNDTELKLVKNAPLIKKRGFLLREEFMMVSKWKSARTYKHYDKNDTQIIKEVTAIAFSSKNEELRIKSLTILHGIKFPAASAILHFFHKEKYPIIDFRALWTLNSDVPTTYTFDFWYAYVIYCRKLSFETKLDMRTIDKALWAYSKLKQTN